MITQQTCLILGAGSSMPYGYPSGKKLIELIIEGLDDNKKGGLLNYLYELDFNELLIQQFEKALSYSGKVSIDALLETRTDLIEIGKFAIAYVILKAENESFLYPKDDHWYEHIWNKLSSDLSSFNQNKLKIITFNYDVSFEKYLYNALEFTYNIDRHKIVNCIKEIEIVHVHGKVNSLKWENNLSFDMPILNPNEEFRRIFDSSKMIKIIHEMGVDDKEFIRAREILQWANFIYVLGFGYHELNLKRLQLDNVSRKMIGSCFNLTKMEIGIIHEMAGKYLEFGSSEYQNLDFIRNCTRIY